MKVIRTILVQLFLGANVATLLLLWACCASTYLSPETYPRISLAGLAFPFVLVPNILFIFFWLIFKIKYVWVPVVGLLVCGSFIRDYFPVNWSSSVTEAPTLSVLSYNSHSYGGKDATKPDGTNECEAFLQESDADIICLQESHHRESLDKAMKERGYESSNNAEFTVFSRLPILSSERIEMGDKDLYAMRFLLLDEQDTIMLINSHLESNKLSPQVKQAYRDALAQHESDSVRKELVPILRLLALASPTRSQQADSIVAIVEAWLPKPVIVCGDFNDTPVSYTYRVLTRQLTSAFRESGHGAGFTFHEKGFPVRIDHILFSGDFWESYETRVDRSISCSDHFPIHTKLVKKTR